MGITLYTLSIILVFLSGATIVFGLSEAAIQNNKKDAMKSFILGAIELIIGLIYLINQFH